MPKFNNYDMTLFHNDPKAADPNYHKVQQLHPECDPPSLLVNRTEYLYEICHDIVDKKFIRQIKDNFGSCYSELYFGATFRKRLGLNVSHPKDVGPDFYLKDLDCWAEAVTLSNGEKDNPSSITSPQCGAIIDSMEVSEQIKLRITGCFKEKAQKLSGYIKKGLVLETQRAIICINGGWIEGFHRYPMYPEGGFPDVVCALLPVGNMLLVIDRNNLEITERTFEFRDTVIKKKRDSEPQLIRTDYFTDPDYAHISAVIYSYANVNDSVSDFDLGNDFFVIHNPLARCPLPEGAFKCGIEYKVRVDDSTINIKTKVYGCP